MPRSDGVWGQQWTICDRCGFLHPLSMLTKQKGLLLCTDHGCLDNLDVERREIIIGKVLSTPGEFEDEKRIVQQVPGEVPFF